MQSDTPQTVVVETDCPVCLNLNRAARRACRHCEHRGRVLKHVPTTQPGHTCQVCFLPSYKHEDRQHWPARCCHGCGCGEEMPEPVMRPLQRFT